MGHLCRRFPKPSAWNLSKYIFAPFTPRFYGRQYKFNADEMKLVWTRLNDGSRYCDQHLPRFSSLELLHPMYLINDRPSAGSFFIRQIPPLAYPPEACESMTAWHPSRRVTEQRAWANGLEPTNAHIPGIGAPRVSCPLPNSLPRVFLTFVTHTQGSLRAYLTQLSNQSITRLLGDERSLRSNMVRSCNPHL